MGAGLSAQGPGELVTDRPDFTESSEVIARGWMQLESGFADERFRDGGSAWTMGAPLLRVGLGRKFELRLASEGVTGERASGESRKFGRADAEVGMKYKFLGESRFRPALGVIAAVAMPTGVEGVSSGAFEPGVKLTWAKSMPAGFGLSGNVNWNALASEDGRLHHAGVSISAAHDLVWGLGGYWEVYGLSAAERDGSGLWMFNTGVTRAIGANAQWDASIGQRLTGAGPDRFYSAGLTIREPFGVIRSLR